MSDAKTPTAMETPAGSVLDPLCTCGHCRGVHLRLVHECADCQCNQFVFRQPSPLPWTWESGEMDGDAMVGGASLRDLTGRSCFVVDCGDHNGLSNANAEFIVLAVNHHHELIDALKLVRLRALETNTATGEQCCSMCAMHVTAAHQKWCPIPAVKAVLAKVTR